MHSAERMTVLQIVPSLNVGGAERATIDIANALVQAGHRSLVVSSGGSLVESLVCNGSEHFLWDVSSKNPFTILKNRGRLIDFIASQNVDIVHARSRAPAWSAYLATRAARAIFVTTFHDAYPNPNAAKQTYNSVMAKGDRVIAISKFIDRHIREHYGDIGNNISLIPRGIDFSIFERNSISCKQKEDFLILHKLDPNIPLLVYPARLSRRKGHELTLRALFSIRHRRFICVVIGPDQRNGAYRKHLQSLIKTFGLDDKVRLVANADLPTAYALADVVLSPSQKPEGFGRVPVEAQAMGVPVIATALGATSETVLDGETGWLVPPGNSEALAQAIEHALSLSEEQRQVMATKALTHVRASFDVRRMCAATIEVYTDLVNTRRTIR